MKKKVQRRTPGGRTVARTKKKMTAKHKCAVCHKPLHGTPRGSPSKIKKLPKTKRRPSRPFGGQLCSHCSRIVVSLKSMIKNKIIELKDTPISLRRHL